MSLLLKTLSYPFRKARGLTRIPARKAALAQFRALRFSPGDLAIDCGANRGDVTADLAARGATVHAFEPHPDAFSTLAQRFAGDPAVLCLPMAVSDQAGKASLYLHRRHRPGSLTHSQGSSLCQTKHNLDPDRSVEVATIDLAQYIADLNRPVKLLKIDIEGAEARLLNHLIDTGAIHRVEQVFCETHEYKVPGLARDCRRLRQRLASLKIRHVNLDWG